MAVPRLIGGRTTLGFLVRETALTTITSHTVTVNPSFASPMADPTPRFGFVPLADTFLATELLTGQSILQQFGLS